MQRTTQPYFKTCVLPLFGMLLLADPSAPAFAQTVFSPAPIMPLRSRSIPVGIIPAASPGALHHPEAEPDYEKTFHIPLILNENVESQIEFFTTSGRTVFQNWLRRSARYLPLMKQIFREYNLPEDLVYVAMIESGFNPNAVSPQKAVGPWQFMLATGREYGLSINRWVDERKDPVKSTRAAAAHLKNLYNTFGSWLMALASYNAGTGRMQGAALKARSDDFWDICASRILHSETQEYVPRFLAAMIIAKNPVAYGFADPELKPFEFEEIVVPRSTDLRKIARYAGSTYEELRDLNPELLQHATPQNRYVLRLPLGTRETYQRQAASASLRRRTVQVNREKKERNSEPPLSKRTAAKPVIPPGWKNPPIVSPYAAQLGSDLSTSGRSEVLLSSDNVHFRVRR